MAQPSTTYKFELNLTDLDRNVYQSVKQTIARHPSETEERMAVRLLAYALWYNEQLSFGRGLSDVDEPALWEKSLDDRVLHWIEVGQPDADRLTWCSRRTERTSLLAYGSLRVWETKVVPAVKCLKNLNIAAVRRRRSPASGHSRIRSGWAPGNRRGPHPANAGPARQRCWQWHRRRRSRQQ